MLGDKLNGWCTGYFFDDEYEDYKMESMFIDDEECGLSKWNKFVWLYFPIDINRQNREYPKV